jgi:hypothetical protein
MLATPLFGQAQAPLTPGVQGKSEAAAPSSQATEASTSGNGYTVRYNGSAYEFRLIGSSNVGTILKDGTVVGMMMPDGKGGERLMGTTSSQAAPDVIAAYSARKNADDGSSRPTTPALGTSCPATYGPNYWDGSAWKPMMLAVNLKKQKGVSISGTLKNPLDPMGGYTNIRRFQEPAAPVTMGSSPRFCLLVPTNINPSSIFIGSVDVKNDHREVESSFRADSWIPAKRIQAIDTKRISDTIVEVTPAKPLQPGQYVLNGPTGIYDFGVDGRK